VVLAWPFDSIVLLAMVTGVSLVALGIVQIVRSLQIRREMRRAPQLPHVAPDAVTPVNGNMASAV
jgi:uncharacterized membrane protein HdeD (DUF308 family)